MGAVTENTVNDLLGYEDFCFQKTHSLCRGMTDKLVLFFLLSYCADR